MRRPIQALFMFAEHFSRDYPLLGAAFSSILQKFASQQTLLNTAYSFRFSRPLLLFLDNATGLLN